MSRSTSLYGAIHGHWCGAKTWRTLCPTCRAEVFYFSCDCGAKVFFDELGSPWPLHDCDTSWTRKLKRTTSATGKIEVELGPGIKAFRQPEPFRIDEGIVSRARSNSLKFVPDPIVAIEAIRHERREIVGFLREIYRTRNPFEVYGLEETTVSGAILGLIGQHKVGQITVHVPCSSKNQSESFTTWIPSELLKDSRIVRGLTVALAVEGIQLLGHGPTWFCDDFEVLG